MLRTDEYFRMKKVPIASTPIKNKEDVVTSSSSKRVEQTTPSNHQMKSIGKKGSERLYRIYSAYTVAIVKKLTAHNGLLKPIVS